MKLLFAAKIIRSRFLREKMIKNNCFLTLFRIKIFCVIEKMSKLGPIIFNTHYYEHKS